MTFDEAQKIVKAITYKPNVRIELERHWNHEGATLSITAKVKDVRWPNNNTPEERWPIVPISSRQTVNLEMIQSKAQLLSFVRDALRRLEEHELDEWFRHEGELVNDPHPEERLMAFKPQLLEPKLYRDELSTYGYFSGGLLPVAYGKLPALPTVKES